MTDPFDLGSDDLAAPAGAAEAPYLAALNEAQRQAVEATEGPVLVLAGAGTGKTRVLTTRLVHLVATQRAWPGQILAVTFTNRAASEMHERVAEHIGGVVESLWLGTFHAMGVRILRRHAELVGLKSGFTILDTDDQIRLLKQVLEAANVDPARSSARALLAIIERWKSRGLGPEKVPAAEVGEFAGGRALDLYRAYQGRLRALNATDFGDLLLLCIDLFTGHEEVLADYRRRFKYILVDEYQDTNVAQYLWLRLLAQGRNNICCVGDDDQSIYSWRGAEVDNILRFENDFAGARVIRLERNYRSTPHILGAAAGLVAHNQGRLGKELWTEAAAGAPVVVRGVWDGGDEARTVADEIEALQAKGERLAEIAILVRTGSQTREFEERFLKRGLPYRVIGGQRFYERHEIRDVIAYLRVIAQGADDLAFERIVNVPKRGIGGRSVQVLQSHARERRLSLYAAAAEVLKAGRLKGRARAGLTALLEGFERWRAAAQALPLAELAATVIEDSGYSDMWEADKSPDAPGRLENLKELVHALEEFESLADFLEHVSLVMDNATASGGDAVNLMTLHGAKGLEFDNVFLPGWEEGLIPHQRALDEGGDKALEEERRLAHVGITRARKLVHISHAASRRVFNQWLSNIPSRFVDELPTEHIEMRADPGLYAGLGAARQGGLEESEQGFAQAPPRPALGHRQSRYDRFVRGQGPLKAANPAKARLPESDTQFSAGDRVFHQKFGYGHIVAVDANKLDIAFEKAGTKKVIANFVERA